MQFLHISEVTAFDLVSFDVLLAVGTTAVHFQSFSGISYKGLSGTSFGMADVSWLKLKRFEFITLYNSLPVYCCCFYEF